MKPLAASLSKPELCTSLSKTNGKSPKPSSTLLSQRAHAIGGEHSAR
jgi:hypothetical protein